MSAAMDGHITLTGLSAGVNFVVRFFTPNTDTEIFKACAPTSDGDFTIYGIPAGTYDVGIKCDGSLSNLIEDKVFTNDQTTEVDFGSLRAGDVKNEDHDIGLADRIVMYANWNETGDCDGYAGDWLIPQCPSSPPAGGACYGYVIT